jgi:hypothetical protein
MGREVYAKLIRVSRHPSDARISEASTEIVFGSASVQTMWSRSADGLSPGLRPGKSSVSEEPTSAFGGFRSRLASSRAPFSLLSLEICVGWISGRAALEVLRLSEFVSRVPGNRADAGLPSPARAKLIGGQVHHKPRSTTV